jgi:hypothetical protein
MAQRNERAVTRLEPGVSKVALTNNVADRPPAIYPANWPDVKLCLGLRGDLDAVELASDHPQVIGEAMCADTEAVEKLELVQTRIRML